MDRNQCLQLVTVIGWTPIMEGSQGVSNVPCAPSWWVSDTPVMHHHGCVLISGNFIIKFNFVSTPWKILIPLGNYGLYKSIWVGNNFFHAKVSFFDN